jgi:hypothetical protein
MMRLLWSYFLYISIYDKDRNKKIGESPSLKSYSIPLQNKCETSPDFHTIQLFWAPYISRKIPHHNSPTTLSSCMPHYLLIPCSLSLLLTKMPSPTFIISFPVHVLCIVNDQINEFLYIVVKCRLSFLGNLYPHCSYLYWVVIENVHIIFLLWAT